MRAAVGIRWVPPLRNHLSSLSVCYYSFSLPSVAGRLRKNTNTKGSRRKQKEDALARESRSKLVRKVETSVRDRLRKEFPREFEVSWFRTNPTLSSLETLLALNGFRGVAKPSGNKYRLYLAEGVVATPPTELTWGANTIPTGYQEFARGIAIDKVGVFGDVHHLVKATESRDRLYAQPIDLSNLHHDDRKKPSPSKPKSSTSKAFPEFVQEDIALYRSLEKSSALFLDSTYTRWTTWTHRNFIRPLNDARYRTWVAIKSANAVRARVNDFFEKSLVERVWERIGNGNGNGDSNSNRVVASSTIISEQDIRGGDGGEEKKGKIMNTDEKKDAISHKKSAESVPIPPSPVASDVGSGGDGEKSNDADECDDPLETLVVISSRSSPKRSVATTSTTRRDSRMVAPIPTPSRIDDDDEIVDSVALYRQITPSTRILTLSDFYVLRHSSASNLVNISLIVLLALPLSYRSYVFAIDYDWLVGSGPIAASVVLTITYYILIARWRARTSQSKAIQEALCARVGARDEAALLLLKEGAVRSIAGAVLEASEDGRFSQLIECGSSSSNNNNHKRASIDPREWAIDFGLLEEPPNADDNGS